MKFKNAIVNLNDMEKKLFIWEKQNKQSFS